MACCRQLDISDLEEAIPGMATLLFHTPTVIDSMALASSSRARARAKALGLDRMKPAQITAEIKAARCGRR